MDGRAPVYEDRYAPYAYSGNADFNYRSFRTTNVLRWEYKPGSTLFVVWQQGRSGDGEQGDFSFGRDFGGVFSAPVPQRLSGEAVVLAEHVASGVRNQESGIRSPGLLVHWFLYLPGLIPGS